MTEEDAANLLVSWLRKPNHGHYPCYGYDIYIPNLVREHFAAEIRNDAPRLELTVREHSSQFYAAAWELCRRGIIRPGVNRLYAQATDEGSAGAGYSITPFGQRWLNESDYDDFVPTESGRFAEMLAEHRQRFGPGFHQRSQEAVRCYGAHAFLSCSVMCGGATESVILAAAIEKKDEESVLKAYRAAGGRRKVENILVGQSRFPLQEEYRGYTTLLKYWRDESAHGQTSDIQDNEAYTSLAMLLRLCKFVDDNWAELTS